MIHTNKKVIRRINIWKYKMVPTEDKLAILAFIIIIMVAIIIITLIKRRVTRRDEYSGGEFGGCGSGDGGFGGGW